MLVVDAGPSLRFHIDSVIALAGAEFKADIDGIPLPFWTSVTVKAGALLTIGMVRHFNSLKGFCMLSWIFRKPCTPDMFMALLSVKTGK